ASASRTKRPLDPADGRRPGTLAGLPDRALPHRHRPTPPRQGPFLLHLHDEGEDPRTAVETLEVPPERLGVLLLALRGVAPRLGVDRRQRVQDRPPGPFEDL